MDDITGDDTSGIADLKCYLQNHFQTKDLECLQFFLDIEVAKFRKKITLSQRKCVPDMLSKGGTLGCRAADAPIKANIKLLSDQEEILDDPNRY